MICFLQIFLGIAKTISVFARFLRLAISGLQFVSDTLWHKLKNISKTPAFFLKLRISVKRRYFDELEYIEYETQVQKLIDKHTTTEDEILRITEMVNIFDKEQRDQEVEKLTSKAAKADHIASRRTIKAIIVKMNEDPVYYKKLCRLIENNFID